MKTSGRAIYQIEIQPKAQRDFDDLPVRDAVRISKRIAALVNNLQGDVKRLTNFTPEYRLRVGEWRVLFEVVHKTIVIHRVRHRREVYR